MGVSISMDMELIKEIVEIITNQGLAIGMVGYFIWYNQTVLKDLTTTMQKLTDAINKMAGTDIMIGEDESEKPKT